jgi:hypothetical protein
MTSYYPNPLISAPFRRRCFGESLFSSEPTDEFVIEFSTFLYTIHSHTNCGLENKGHIWGGIDLEFTSKTAQLEQV